MTERRKDGKTERRKDVKTEFFLWVVEELTFLINLSISLEKIRFRIIIPEFYIIQICKHGQSVVIG